MYFSKIQVLISIALLGAAFADDTCEDCSMVGTKTSAAFTTPGITLANSKTMSNFAIKNFQFLLIKYIDE